MYEVIAHIDEPYDYVQLVLTICTVLIAFVSIIYTGLSYHAQREFYKKNVIPIIDIHIIDGLEELSIALLNNGVGPAIIEKIQSIDERNSSDPLDKLIADDKKKWYFSETSDLKRKYVIGPGKGLTILSVNKQICPDDLNYSHSVNNIKQNLNRARIIIQYSDVYGEQMQLDKEMSFRGEK